MFQSPPTSNDSVYLLAMARWMEWTVYLAGGFNPTPLNNMRNRQLTWHKFPHIWENKACFRFHQPATSQPTNGNLRDISGFKLAMEHTPQLAGITSNDVNDVRWTDLYKPGWLAPGAHCDSTGWWHGKPALFSAVFLLYEISDDFFESWRGMGWI